MLFNQLLPSLILWAVVPAVAVDPSQQVQLNVFFMPSVSAQCTLYASVIEASDDATTYAIGQPPSDATSGCVADNFLGSPFTVGDSTMAYTSTTSGSLTSATDHPAGDFQETDIWACDLKPSQQSGDCLWSRATTLGDNTYSTVLPLTPTSYFTDQVPVVVTAGAEKLKSLPTTTASASTHPTQSAVKGAAFQGKDQSNDQSNNHNSNDHSSASPNMRTSIGFATALAAFATGCTAFLFI